MNDQKPSCPTGTCTLGNHEEETAAQFVYPHRTIRNATKHWRRNQKVLLGDGRVVKFKKTETYKRGRPIVLV